MNKDKIVLSEFELEGLFAKPPLPADRGFSDNVETMVAKEVSRARTIFIGASALWVLISSAFLINCFPAVSQLIDQVTFEIPALASLNFDLFAMLGVSPMLLLAILAPIAFIAMVRATD